jgi:5'-nucleotidase
MKYDAVTLGNHEFDWGSDHLARVLAAAAVDERFDIPILATNMITDDTDPGDDRLEALVADGTIARSTILDLPGGLRVGLLSWLGKGAAAVAPMKAPVTFDEDMTAAQTIAAALRADGADVVVALTHIGLAAGLGDPIDDNLARAAEDIDVIVGGHSHDALDEVRVVDGTLIVQAGAYTRFLGELTVEIDGDAVTLVDYVLHPIDDSIEGDAEMQSFVERYIAAVDVACTPVGVTYFEEVAETAFDLTTPGLAESNLGNLVTDAYRTLAAAVTSADPVIAAFESDGVIRDDILAGDEGVIAFADVFRALPLGIGPDRFPGYPLVSFWVTGAELKNACEVSASLSGVAGGDYFIQISGLRCRRDPTAAWLGRVQEVFLGNDIAGYDATPVDLADTTTLYRVAVDLYVAGLMSVIGDYTFGMLQIVPKQSDGTPVADMTAMILDGDPLTAGVQEMKLWGVLWTYLTMFPDADADTLPDVPALYAAPTGRYYAE